MLVSLKLISLLEIDEFVSSVKQLLHQTDQKKIIERYTMTLDFMCQNALQAIHTLTLWSRPFLNIILKKL